MTTSLRVGVVGDYDSSFPPHVATDSAVAHAAAAEGLNVDVSWIPTEPLERELGAVEQVDALWCAPGSPYRSLRGAVRALQYSRENAVPTLGTCGGCQHMIIEYARNVLGFEDAQHAEYDPYGSRLFVSELACSLAGRTMPVSFAAGSKVAELYGASTADEQYYCNFGLNEAHRKDLDDGGFIVSGSDADGEARVLEAAGHPFYVATLFVPQTRSTPGRPHPLVVGLLRAAARRAATAAHAEM